MKTCSELGSLLSEFSKSLGCWWGEEIGSELGGLGEVTLDLHLSSHEGGLSVHLSEADSFKIIISHGESGILLSGLAFFTVTVSVLEVKFINLDGLGSLLGDDLPAEGGLDLFDDVFSLSL